MKAARIHHHGGPEVLVYEDAPDPRIRADQVLVRVRACALNHLDLWLRQGIPGVTLPMPHILGSDIAGEVVEAGDLCWRVKPGQRVLLAPGLSCRQCPRCLEGIGQPLPALCGVRQRPARRQCRTGGGAGVRGRSHPERVEVRGSGRGAAGVPHRLAHAVRTRARLSAGEDVLVMAGVERRRIGRRPTGQAVPLPRHRHRRRRAQAASRAPPGRGSRHRPLPSGHRGRGQTHHRPPRRRCCLRARRRGHLAQERAVRLRRAAAWSPAAPPPGADVKLDLRFLFFRQQSALGSFMGTLGELHQALSFVFRGLLRARHRPGLSAGGDPGGARAAGEQRTVRQSGCDSVAPAEAAPQVPALPRR